MKKSIATAAWMAATLCVLSAQTVAQGGSVDLEQDPFLGRPSVFPLVHADPAARFEAAVPTNRYWGTGKIATVSIAPHLRVRIEAQEEPSFPSWVKLIDIKTGAPLKTVAVYGFDEAVWYFPGNGIFYLRQRDISLCGPRILRKFEVQGQTLQEVDQPFHYVGVESKVALDALSLYAHPEKGAVVAVAPKGSTVFVVGAMRSKDASDPAPPLLVRTSLGLIGWHVRGEPGQLDIYQCN